MLTDSMPHGSQTFWVLAIANTKNLFTKIIKKHPTRNNTFSICFSHGYWYRIILRAWKQICLSICSDLLDLWSLKILIPPNFVDPNCCLVVACSCNSNFLIKKRLLAAVDIVRFETNQVIKYLCWFLQLCWYMDRTGPSNSSTKHGEQTSTKRPKKIMEEDGWCKGRER